MDIYRKIARFYGQVKTEKKIIGKSLQNRNLYAVKVGDGYPVGLAVYGMHAREWVSSRLAIDHYYRDVFGSVWLVPLINPDGAILSQRGKKAIVDDAYKPFLSAYSDAELRLWKANARGVDLNINFDARWGQGETNVRLFGGANCVGKHPFSEPETAALRDFTLALKPNYTISFHTKGEEIYWYFGQSSRTCLRDFRVGSILSQATRYPLKLARGSVGGYKDWCVERLGIPSYTVELGNDRLAHPLGMGAYLEIREKCADALFALSCAMKDIE